MAYDSLAIEHDGPVARVWLDRPDRLNALDARTLEEIADAFIALQTAYDTRVVVLGGRGRAFCAGADRKNPPARLARGSGASPRERRYAAQMGRRALEAIERLEAVTIARLHGYVIGGGLVLAVGCDFRLAAAGTVLQIPEVDLGIPLTWGAVPRLLREVGPSRAKELVLLGDRFDAEAAHRLGLVNAVASPEGLDALVDEWARRLADKPPWAVHMTKSQFQAYGAGGVLGDVTTLDGDLLSAATEEDPMRFRMPSQKP